MIGEIKNIENNEKSDNDTLVFSLKYICYNENFRSSHSEVFLRRGVLKFIRIDWQLY